MKTALKVIVAIASILTLIMGGLGLFSNPGSKKAAIYFMVFACIAWGIYICLVLISKHAKTQTSLSVTRVPTVTSSETIIHQPSQDMVLDEIKTEILITIAQVGDSCDINRLEERLNYNLKAKGEKPIDRITLDCNLEEMDEKYIHLNLMIYGNPRTYSLLHNGRKYLVENKLVGPNMNSN